MDVLVLWKDGTRNVVCAKELLYRGVLKLGTQVKMFIGKNGLVAK